MQKTTWEGCQLVAEAEFTLDSGRKAVCRVWDNADTVPASDKARHQRCAANLEHIAASILASADKRP